MEVTTKELRIQPGKIIDQVVNGQEVVITFRGKALAKIIPFSSSKLESKPEDIDIFGMWKERDKDVSVEDVVKTIRKGRQF
jgi:prevent-host-death family protein